MISKKNTTMKEYNAANIVIEKNKDAEKKLLELIAASPVIENNTVAVYRNDDEHVLSRATLDIFHVLNVDLLSAFYKCRILSDLTKQFVLPLKGTPEKVINDEAD